MKHIDIVNYLIKLGFRPVKTRSQNVWFKSPFRSEKTPSFKVDTQKNLWYDFGRGEGGTIIDFVMKYEKVSFKEAVRILKSDSFSFHRKTNVKDPQPSVPNYRITKVGPVQNRNLILFLNDRKLNFEIVNRYCFQVHYEFSTNKEYYGIGFMNDSGAFEIRNKYFKGCLGKKNITTINNNSKVVSLFEGWSDFLSYLSHLNYVPQENFIILNSTSLVKKALELVPKFELIKTYFDNDLSGDFATKMIQDNSKNEFKDCRGIYRNFKDFNEYLMKTIL